MSNETAGPPVLVLSASWQGSETELSFVTRAIAGAASRHRAVTVVTPMPSYTTVPDGAFDLRGIGQQGSDAWPRPSQARWVPPPDPRSPWVLDDPSPLAVALVAAFGDGSNTHTVRPVGGDGAPGVRSLPLLPGRGSDPALGVYVPVNPLAATHRHGGLGFTGYLLVLTDRPSAPATTPPTADVAWLTARFHQHYVVVVEGGSAAVWKGRALRGIVRVDTRIDLWRLLAHAWAVVDLAPGEIIARECVESLRFGTPIIVPRDTPGATHTYAGGGFTFANVPELLERVEQILNSTNRERCSRHGAAYAEARHGNPSAFVAGIARVLFS